MMCLGVVFFVFLVLGLAELVVLWICSFYKNWKNFWFIVSKFLLFTLSSVSETLVTCVLGYLRLFQNSVNVYFYFNFSVSFFFFCFDSQFQLSSQNSEIHFIAVSPSSPVFFSAVSNLLIPSSVFLILHIVVFICTSLCFLKNVFCDST